MSGKGRKLIEFHYTYLLMAFGFVITGYYLNLFIFTSLILIHEFGHYLMAKIFRFRVLKIIIYPYGGVTKIDDFVDRNINLELVVACFGIIMQYLFYSLISYLHYRYYIRDYTFNLYSIYNGQMIFFNMLPIIPLDGAKIVNLILNKFFCYNLSNIITVFISIICLILIIILDVYSYNYSNVMILSLFVWYIYYFVGNFKYMYNRFMLERYLYFNNYKRVRRINNINNMFRNSKNLLFGYVDEDVYLRDYFSGYSNKY